MPELPVVNGPPVLSVAEGRFEGGGGPANSYLQELTLVDEQLEVVPTSSHECLRAHRCLEPRPILGLALEIVLGEGQFGTCSLGVPGEYS